MIIMLSPLLPEQVRSTGLTLRKSAGLAGLKLSIILSLVSTWCPLAGQ